MPAHLDRMQCEICQCQDIFLAKHEDDFTYYKCNSCGCLFLYPKPDEATIERFYQRSCGATFDCTVETGLLFSKNLEAIKRFRIIKRFISGRNVCEIGCGGGYLLNHLKACGYNVWGIEMSRPLIEFACRKFGLNVDYAPKTKLFERTNFFDTVIMLEVISHLPHPLEYMNKIHKILKKNGVVILQTGNFGDIDDISSVTLGAPEHIFLFSIKGLRTLLTKAGFVVDHICGFNIYPQAQLLKFSKKGSRKTTFQPISAYKERWTGKLFSIISLLLRYNLGREFWKKKSAATLFVVAKKSV